MNDSAKLNVRDSHPGPFKIYLRTETAATFIREVATRKDMELMSVLAHTKGCGAEYTIDSENRISGILIDKPGHFSALDAEIQSVFVPSDCFAGPSHDIPVHTMPGTVKEVI